MKKSETGRIAEGKGDSKMEGKERTEQMLMTDWEFALVKKAPTRADVGMTEAEEKPDIPEGLVFQKVDLPHDWAVDMPFNRDMEGGRSQGFQDRWGIGWYRKNIYLQEKKVDSCYMLVFGGVYENCTIWINGRLTGSHRYGYSTFRLEISEYLETGENDLIVKVDNTIFPADRWYSGCGIYRSVRLVETKRNHLDPWDVTVHTEFDNGKAIVKVDAGLRACVRGTLQYHGTGSDCGTEAGVDRAAKDSVLRTENGEGRLTFVVEEPCRWSAEHPDLYGLTLELVEDGRVLDRICRRIGLREIEMIPGRGMFVNGAAVKLKGVCIHQECGGLGTAVRPEIWRERLALLKEMGCNAIRPAHHTFSEEFMDLCDEMGFYVYEECFDKWKGGLYGRYFDQNWKQDVEAMVKRDRNRPSVIIWGVGNEVENQGQETMLSLLRMLCDQVRCLDGTRPVTYAMNPHFKRESQVDLSKITDIQKFVDEESDTEIYDPLERVERISRIGEIVDILSCNYQEQWYDLIHEKMPDKLILGTECYQYFRGHCEQMQNFTDRIPAMDVMERDYCIGGMIWTGYDYLGESMGYPAKGWSGAMIRTNNEVRPMYYFYQNYWTSKPVVRFAVMDYSLEDEGCKEHWDTPIYAEHWQFPQFNRTLIPYRIVTNCEEVELRLNGKRFYVPSPTDSGNGVITGFLPWQPGKVEVTGYIGGTAVCTHVVVTPGPATDLKFVRESVKIEDQSLRGYQQLLTVRAMDAAGNLYFRESGRVRFRVEGPAEILAVDNGDVTGGESRKEDRIHLYHGCASVIIRLTGEPGRISVWADGDGLHSGRCVVEAGEISPY
ncbi:glycoside hydrolase family 2 protein [Acetatifactor muris]|uniref:glycoside hydrolase family 2 protein n=1 Tax=Acetatifactor muris TaxID=879566 RepID=UPI0023F4ACC3|nr:glycoside hydrolase family 2 TIM barrel-domain containing protein [Acetatifactor muris]